MPALCTQRVASETVPDCSRVGVFTGSGLISYQLICEPAPPATVWATQTPVLFPCPGSIPETAWVMRPSSVSSRSEEPFCGASGGDMNDPTVISEPLILNCGTNGLVGLVRKAWTLTFVPVPQMSGHSMSDSVMTQPVPEESV